MRNLFLPKCGLIVSSAFIMIGFFFLTVFPSILRFFVRREFMLSPKSQSFKHWKKTPLPVSLDFYLFNWTNPEEITDASTKPTFAEVGPYRFYEKREKLNLTWNDNGTISYRQARTWLFSAEESTGSLDDVVTSLNGVTTTAAYKLRNSGYLPQSSFNWVFRAFDQNLAVSYSVRDFLFDGYDNDLMNVAHTAQQMIEMPVSSLMSSPFDKFAWFYKRNGSHTFDGWFNLDTGEKEMNHLGQLKRWNHKNHTGFYQGECGRVNGFTGDLYPPGFIKNDTKLNIFAHDLCRSLPLHYSGDTYVRGLHGYTFKARLRPEDDATRDPRDSCYCNGECVPSGFLNLTECRYGAPVFVSLPHFYDAHPVYQRKVEGLRPDPAKHQFYVTIEPTYGIPIDVGARIQINMLLQPIKRISMYEKVPRLMFPILWVDQRVQINAPLALHLRVVILLPTIATVLGVFFLSLGCVLFVLYLVMRARSRGLPPTK